MGFWRNGSDDAAPRSDGARWGWIRRALRDGPTRRDVLRGAGALGAGALVASASLGEAIDEPAAQAAQATPEATPEATPGGEPQPEIVSPEVRAIIDTAATIEAMETTLIGVARQRAAQALLDLGESATVVRYLRAAQCQEEAHYHFWQSEGAAAATVEFSFPDRTFRSRSAFLRTLLDLEQIEIGLYMAAARALAALGEYRLAEVAYQTGVVEGQHYAVLKGFLDEFPANDRAFAEWRFADVAAAGEAIAATGFLDPDAPPLYAFPGPVERFCRGVFGLVPATTESETT
jgi:hypothetical protein